MNPRGVYDRGGGGVAGCGPVLVVYPHDAVYLFRQADFPAYAGNYAPMVDYFAYVVHISTIVLEINKNISKGAENGL